MSDSSIRSRKDDHIQINLKNDVESGIPTGLSNYHFIHNGLHELDIQSINLSQKF